jgi:N-acetylmuramoyl-L-alanine amidase
MPRPEKIKGVAIHCSAGYSSIEAIEIYWWDILGWRKSKGYNAIVDLDGQIWYLVKPTVRTGGYSKTPSKSTYRFITNGVLGFNDEYIHISYVGGVKKDNYKIAKDTRTPDQKLKLQHLISDSMLWLESQEQNTEVDFWVGGHRDFSDDQNGNGEIDTWERIKECPSFDAMHEYLYYTSIDRRLKLPTDR